MPEQKSLHLLFIAFLKNAPTDQNGPTPAAAHGSLLPKPALLLTLAWIAAQRAIKPVVIDGGLEERRIARRAVAVTDQHRLVVVPEAIVRHGDVAAFTRNIEHTVVIRRFRIGNRAIAEVAVIDPNVM